MPTGQWEAAESLAFTRQQTLWQIILPQCFKRMIPPWMNWYAILTMATPLCSLLGVEEIITLSARRWRRKTTTRNFWSRSSASRC